ncbi:MAG: CHAD domain-containing protein, partial [Methanoregula sp.]
MREIKKITRALGAARDTDVQVAFLKKYLKAQAVPVPKDKPGPVPAPAGVQDPVAAYLQKLQKRRKVLQQEVIAELDEFLGKQVLTGIRAACPVPSAAGRRRRRERYAGILPVAADRIGRCLSGLDRYEPFVHNPDAVFEHHAMRIAAKKLRYTLETYAPLYRRNLVKPIAQVKKLQELLGDIHDCDVWIEQMTVAITRQRSHRHPLKDPAGATVSAVAPLRQLLVNRERQRARLYRQYVRSWETLVRTGFRDGLMSAVLNGQKTAFSHRSTSSDAEEHEAFEHLARLAPEQADHSHTVAALALRLFDELAPLHGLLPRDRTLLLYAADVHDIGWAFGQVDHQKKSAELVLSCGDLPVPVREQGIIALIAGLHGGSDRFRPTGFWHLLSLDDKNRVKILAALLRVADGLDYLHAATVTDLHCSIGESDVQCVLSCTGNVATEKARAIKKSALFCDVFKKSLVIP